MNEPDGPEERQAFYDDLFETQLEQIEMEECEADNSHNSVFSEAA